MRRASRHRRTSVLLVLLLCSTGLHGGALALYEGLKPTPWPRLVLDFQGKGAGVVESSPPGISCADDCSARFEPGTRVRLVATVADRATFEGWEKGCTPVSDWILECELTIEEDTQVGVRFGRMPERVELAWITPPDETVPEEITVTLPDPEIEAELLMEPLAELMTEPETLPPELIQPKLPEPPPEQAEAQPAPKLEEMPNMTSVEVPDENEVEEAPEDATHLSDKNRDVAEETHATDTNLERAQDGEAVVTEASDIKSENIGAREDEIAQTEDAEPETLENQDGEEASESGQGREVMGMLTGEDGEDGEDGQEGDDRPTDNTGVLAMRDITGRGSLVPRKDDPGDGGKRGTRGDRGKRGVRTELSFQDYERIVGQETLDQEMLLGRQKKKSKRMGRYERKLGAVKAALENFTPDVRPGNQTALKTRRAPFAVYIARMHRSIHELWGFGFLDDLDGKPADHPLNNWDLWTKLEIVIDPDGTIHKITIVHHSGILEFDVAAIDAVLTGEPYGDTPEEIRSPDGRIYIHWGFYRNHRQCGTFNANPFILSEVPKGSDKALDDGDLARNVPGRKARETSRSVREAMAEGESENQGASQGDTAARAPSGPPSPTDREAEHTANRFVSAFSYGRLAKLLEITAAPFSTEKGVVANSVEEAKPIYQLLMKESPPPIRDWKLMTAAGYRKRFGDLPPGVDAGKPQLFMVVVTRGERFTVQLTRTATGGFEITGVFR